MPISVSADPLWYKDAVFYQLHVKSCADSNADGIGDFVGLTSKLDHLESLGVNCLWMQPIYPSPFRDDGYDISDYTNIHPSYRIMSRLLAATARVMKNAAAATRVKIPSWMISRWMSADRSRVSLWESCEETTQPLAVETRTKTQLNTH